jgi:hypothetical protein
VSGVMFGHHLGDVQENVISNVMRCVLCQLKHLLHFEVLVIAHVPYIAEGPDRCSCQV